MFPLLLATPYATLYSCCPRLMSPSTSPAFGFSLDIVSCKIWNASPIRSTSPGLNWYRTNPNWTEPILFARGGTNRRRRNQRKEKEEKKEEELLHCFHSWSSQATFASGREACEHKRTFAHHERAISTSARGACAPGAHSIPASFSSVPLWSVYLSDLDR